MTYESGDRVRVRHDVRVGLRSWPTEVTGTILKVEPVVTSIHTDRVAKDDIWVNSLLLEKPDGELCRVTLDESSRVEVLAQGPRPTDSQP